MVVIMVDRLIPVALVEMAAEVMQALDIVAEAQQELQTLAAVLAQADGMQLTE